MVHIHTQQRQGLAATLEPQIPYVYYSYYKSQGLTALLRLQRIFYL